MTTNSKINPSKTAKKVVIKTWAVYFGLKPGENLGFFDDKVHLRITPPHLLINKPLAFSWVGVGKNPRKTLVFTFCN